MASESEQTWLQMVLNGTDPLSATKEVFDCTLASSQSSKTSQLKKRYAEDIHKAVIADLEYLAPSALQTIKEIAKDSKIDSVKLKACQDLLSRAGYDAIKKTENVTASKEEIKARIDAILDTNPDLLSNLLSMVDTQPTTKH